MAVGMVAAEANEDLDAWGAEYTWIQLHIGDPGAAGTANVAGETDRVQVTWAAASGGVLSNSAQLEWLSVAADEDYTHFSVWTLSAAGSFGGSGTLEANAVEIGMDFRIPAGDLNVSLNVAA